MKRIIALLLVAVMAASSVLTSCTSINTNSKPSGPESSVSDSSASEPPADSSTAAEEGAEEPIDPGYDEPDDWSDDWASRPIPSSFDLRNVDTDGDGVGDRCYVTPVKLQNPYGTCWGFAAIAAAEISLLGSVYDYDPNAYTWLDLSEKQLAYYSHTPNQENGEGLYPGGDSMSDIYCGGQPFLYQNGEWSD